MTDTPMQEPNDLTPPQEGLLPADAGPSDVSSAEAKPKRTRKAKPAEEQAAAADAAASTDEGDAPVARKAAPRRRAKVADAQDQGDAPSAPDAVTTAASVPDAAVDADTAAKPKRAPRRKAAAEAADERDVTPFEAPLAQDVPSGRA